MYWFILSKTHFFLFIIYMLSKKKINKSKKKMGANTTKKIIRNSNKKLHSKRISKVKKRNGTMTIKKGGASEPLTQNRITEIKENINNIASNIYKLNQICKPKESDPFIMYERQRSRKAKRNSKKPLGILLK